MTSPHSKFKPVFTYIEASELSELKKFCKKQKVPMAQIIREGLTARLTVGDPHIQGFNNGIKKAIQQIADLQITQMKFPSGKSFGELITEELEKCYMRENI